MLGLLGVLLAGGLLHSEPAYAQSACDTYPSWPQVAHDAQRTGKSPENLGQPGVDYDKDGNGQIEYHGTNQTINDVAWRRAFQPDKISPQVQAIVYCNKVFVGTEGANGQTASIYAFNAQTGTIDWVYPVGAPVLASVAAEDGKVFFGAMDGAVYALNVDDGSLAWKKQVIIDRGFSTAPVLADNQIMLGGRNGIFYALDQQSGAILWQKDIGAPILQTAAYNNGSDGIKRVFFGGMDMYLYALDATNGTLLWKSKVKGMAMKEYWPVVHQGRVIVNPIREGRVHVLQDDISKCDANPNNCDITLRIFDESNGQELPTIPHSNVPLMNDAMTPPCVSPNGNIILSARINFNIGGSWSEVDLSTRSIVQRLVSASGHGGYNNTDEDMTVSCAQNSVIAIHHNGTASCGTGGAGFSGLFYFPTSTWICYQPGRVSSEMWNNTQGGRSSPASISGGIFYYIATHGITAVNTN
ncbi:MAG: PQQ-binding-like beta-propeller repeat protein [Candidatus Omnitrophica bacterium]|nr:PQQ-binding-like beta-propeller repeat protein [Candidatus Omnitrophota bacterium]